MKAVPLIRTGGPDVLCVKECPIPQVKPGWVLIKVKAFGLNRAELLMRAFEGDADYISLPRILGIECAGEVVDASDSPFIKGQRVIALMGGMGRSFDGSYAEYTLVPSKNVFSVQSELDWIELAAVPESYFTAYGSLTQSLNLQPTETLLVRGGTSTVGLAAIQLGKALGAYVIATTRSSQKESLLKNQGADLVLIENGELAKQLKHSHPNGVAKILELIGPATLLESMRMLCLHGVVCVTGILGKVYALDGFDPIKDIPSGIYLTGFYSNSPNQAAINEIFTLINNKHLHPAIGSIFALEDLAYAHRLMEENKANGKIVIDISSRS